MDSDSDDEIYHDNINNSLGPLGFHPSRSPSPVGGQLPLGNIENNSNQPSFDTITVALRNFHLDTKENFQRCPRTIRGLGGRHSTSVIVSACPIFPGIAHVYLRMRADIDGCDLDFDKYNPIAFASRNLPSSQEQLSKHQAGQFEWVLSIPVSHSAKGSRSFSSSHEDPEHPDETRKLFFGCNLIHRRTQSGGLAGKHGITANIYTLLATQLEGDEVPSATQPGAVEVVEPMSATHAIDSDTTIIRASEEEINESGELMTLHDATSPKNDDMADHDMIPSTHDPPPRIEDSVEALDKLEEELEAATEVAALDRAPSPEDTAECPKPSHNTPNRVSMLPRSNSTAKRPATNSAQNRSVERTSFRKPASLVFSMEEEKPVKSALKKPTASRPASLIVYKAPVKSTKPSTVSTFHLPGDAGVRRLKEQREARVSQHSSLGKLTAPAAKPRAKPTKPPTLPTFELPGEAISRRKREEREKKMREQEEEERKRREFKARPIRTSIVASSYAPRETLASKARRERLSQADEPSGAASSVAKKRQSLTVTATTVPRPAVSTGAHLSTTLPSRGRTSVAVTNGAQISRATSTASTASIHGGSTSGKRSTISAEDIQHQKLRGKEILSRDNSLRAERERERRQREEALKLARKQAAERSRHISHEWAESQRLRRVEGRSM
ncbi:hypothetical protein V8F20_001087 [Naviculisporaceae sp. PSN 640]